VGISHRYSYRLLGAKEQSRAMNPAYAISQAAADGDLETVRELLDQDPMLVHSYARSGWMPLHVAAYCGHLEVAELLLARGADVQAPARDGLGDTPLLKAVIRQRVEMVALLLAHHADVRIPNLADATPLHKAAVYGDPAITQLLLDHGADVHARNSGGQTPLTHAIFNRHKVSAGLLVQHGGRE
jgi:uncharacterized protein